MRTAVRDTRLAEQLVEVPTIVSFSSLQWIVEQTWLFQFPVVDCDSLVLPSSTSCGCSCFFPLFSWVVLLLLWVVLLFQFPFVCCCHRSPSLGGTTFSPSSVGWCCLVHRVVLRCFFSFAWWCLASPPFGGAAFLPSVGWCCCPKSKRKDAPKWKNEK